MNKLIIMLVTLLFALNSWGVCNKELAHGWGGEWAPYVLGTPTNASGFDMEMLQAIVSAAGCTLKHTDKEIPWKRHLEWIKEGKLDLASGASKTAERLEYAYFTDAYRSEYLAIFVKKGTINKFKMKSLDELTSNNFKIGRQRGNTYGAKMEGILKKMGSRVKEVGDTVNNRHKVINGRIDGYLAYLPDEPMTLKAEGLDDKIELLPISMVNTGDIHMMLSKQKNSEETLNALNQGIKTIKSNGVYDEIVARYSKKYAVEKW